MKWMIGMGLAVVIGLAAVPTARAQDGPKPGPEHAMLKKQEGTWDVAMKMAGMEIKGTATFKMELGGLWLASTFEADLFGQKFQGRGMDTYDPVKKKYVAVWMDSMSTSPMVMEGTYDPEKKVLTLSGEGPGMDGKPTKFRSESHMKDDNTILFSMYMGDGKEPGFTITYSRKK